MEQPITSLIPAETGWRAVYIDAGGESETTRVVAWALRGGTSGDAEIVGLVVAGDDPTKIVPAAEGATPGFELARFGFKEDA